MTWQALIAWLLDGGWSPAAAMVCASSCRVVMRSGEAIDPVRAVQAVRLVLDSPSYQPGKPPLLADPDVLASGEEALKTIGKFHPDVILTDLKMEGMGGIELLSAARAENSSLTFIVMTAHGTVPNTSSFRDRWMCRRNTFQFIAWTHWFTILPSGPSS